MDQLAEQIASTAPVDPLYMAELPRRTRPVAADGTAIPLEDLAPQDLMVALAAAANRKAENQDGSTDPIAREYRMGVRGLKPDQLELYLSHPELFPQLVELGTHANRRDPTTQAWVAARARVLREQFPPEKPWRPYDGFLLPGVVHIRPAFTKPVAPVEELLPLPPQPPQPKGTVYRAGDFKTGRGISFAQHEHGPEYTAPTPPPKPKGWGGLMTRRRHKPRHARQG